MNVQDLMMFSDLKVQHVLVVGMERDLDKIWTHGPEGKDPDFEELIDNLDADITALKNWIREKKRDIDPRVMEEVI